MLIDERNDLLRIKVDLTVLKNGNLTLDEHKAFNRLGKLITNFETLTNGDVIFSSDDDMVVNKPFWENGMKCIKWECSYSRMLEDNWILIYSGIFNDKKDLEDIREYLGYDKSGIQI